MKYRKSIEVRYSQITFSLNFISALSFDIFPTFLFRSVLGNELKKMACIFPEKHCASCSLKNTCAYSLVFESPISKDNKILPGRNFAGHPFVLYSPVPIWHTVHSIDLHITVFGKAIEYIPYIYYALKRAGEKGILRDRVRYTIDDVRAGSDQITDGAGTINPEFKVELWNFNQGEAGTEGRIKIRFLTPARMKIKGSYTNNFSVQDFFNTSWRRASQLVSLYGNSNDGFSYFPSENIKMLSNDTRWVDLDRWSSRQRRNMKLGGIIGNIEIGGKFSEGDFSILRFDEIFHVGKNTGFGLGKINIERIK